MIGRSTVVFALFLLGAVASVQAVEERTLYSMRTSVGDETSLQRGAHVFMNYCAGCHSAAFVRYSRIARDAAIPEAVVRDNLMFTTDKIGNTIQIAMRPEDSARWFGITPPDLSVIARVRGADWLYSYLLTFYLDPTRPTGWNNLTFKGTAMPFPLWELQGIQRLAEEPEAAAGAAAPEHHGSQLELASKGALSEDEYRARMRDLVNFLAYMGEPAALERQRVGVWVIAFLIVMAFLMYRLKKEYWRDVH